MANKLYGSYRHLPRRTDARGKPYGPRGVARMVREQKRREALERAARTVHGATKQHRLRCTPQTCSVLDRHGWVSVETKLENMLTKRRNRRKVIQ